MTRKQEIKLFEEKRDPEQTKGWGQIVTIPFPFRPLEESDCATCEGLFASYINTEDHD